MKRVVGLIGGIGSGKSLVAELLARHGATVISGDRLGHEALCHPAIKEELVRRWGPRIRSENGEINRRRVAEIVFADPNERKALEAVSFPWIERRIGEEIEAAQRHPEVGFIVLDAAIMVEAGWDRFCDRIVYVDAPLEVRLGRLIETRGWTAADLDAREKAQLPAVERRKRADHVLDNSGSAEETAKKVEALVEKWRAETDL
jgi:dephospho-CoA kinase